MSINLLKSVFYMHPHMCNSTLELHLHRRDQPASSVTSSLKMVCALLIVCCFFPQVIHLCWRINKKQAHPKGSKCKPRCISVPLKMGAHLDFISLLNSNSVTILSFPCSITETRSCCDNICSRNSCISGKEAS